MTSSAARLKPTPGSAAPAPMQRVKGQARVALAAGARGACLTGLRQAGAAKVFLPRVHAPDPEVVFLNTAGGLTGGDLLEWALELGPNARAVATTQTAERIYTSSTGVARARMRVQVGASGAVDWLPQETILYEGSALERNTRIDLAAGAELLYAETLVLGRAAMGETVAQCHLNDRREIWRDGVPLVIDAVRLRPGALLPGQGALLGDARAVASVIWVAPGVEDQIATVRRYLAETCGDVRAAASAWDGKCVIRLAAHDGWPLRKALAAVLTRLRAAPLPRVWQI